MRIADNNRWILNEFRDSKTFTALNIISIAVNVFLVLVFLAVILGFETEYVARVTRDYDLFTLGVNDAEGTGINLANFGHLENEPNVQQVIPVVLAEYLQFCSSEDCIDIVYAENFWNRNSEGTDLRTRELEYVAGNPISSGDNKGVIISNVMFDELFPDISASLINTSNLTVTITANTFFNDQEITEEFTANVVGVADSTLYGNRLAYIATPLAQRIHNWILRESRQSNPENDTYERIDIVTTDLDSLANLRQEFEEDGFLTTSILDEIDSVKFVLRVIQIVVFAIVSFSGIIAIFNLAITLTSYVMKRRQEIGVLKALGATDLQIQRIFVLHAIYLSFIGSIVGAILAALILAFLQIMLLPQLNISEISAFQLRFTHVFFTTALTMFFSVIATALPARRSSNISPTEIIRSA